MRAEFADDERVDTIGHFAIEYITIIVDIIGEYM
jgi:hypothetical protein